MPGQRTPEQGRIGRYRLFDAIARGGMAQVHLARLDGDAGFARVVAIKRLHAHLVSDADFVAMFRDEARLVARIRHPNVVPILDVVSLPDELFLVMEYVLGESLAQLLRRCKREEARMPPDIAVAIACGVLAGLHAAHEATNENGDPLGIVHRDVSPQNVMVGEDGFARVLDFGVAYAAERIQPTTSHALKGKLEYMAPEQLEGQRVDRRTDVYAAGVVLWEALTGKRLFKGENDGHTMSLVKEGTRVPPSEIVADLPDALDVAVLHALARERDERPATAAAMASELAAALTPASTERVAKWMTEVAGGALAERKALLRQSESESIETETEPSIPVTSVPQAEPLLVPSASDPFIGRASLVSIPPPTPAPTWPRTLILTLLAATVVLGTAWYAIRSVKSDLDRALSNEPAETRGPVGLPERLRVPRGRPAASVPSAISEALAPSVSASASASAKAKSWAPTKMTPAARKKALEAYCNPPYVILGTGQKVMKVACE
jgi:serine/threonine protein kinase